MKSQRRSFEEHGLAGVTLRTCLENLNRAAERLAQAIQRTDRGRPAVVFSLAEKDDGVVEVETLGGEAAREAAAGIVKDFLPGKRITEAKRLPGVLACSPKTLALIDELNGAKQALYQEIQLIDAGGRLPPDERPSKAEQKKHPKRFKPERQALLSKLAPSLHLKQCYRQVNVLKRRPNLISFTWARNVKARAGVDVPKVRELLEEVLEQCDKKPDPIGCRMRVTSELDRLRQFPSNAQFVLSRPVAPHLRVNLRFGSQPHTGMDFASLPLCCEDDGRGLPEVIPPAALHPDVRARAKRRDARLGKPVFPVVHVYLPD